MKRLILLIILVMLAFWILKVDQSGTLDCPPGRQRTGTDRNMLIFVTPSETSRPRPRRPVRQVLATKCGKPGMRAR